MTASRTDYETHEITCSVCRHWYRRPDGALGECGWCRETYCLAGDCEGESEIHGQVCVECSRAEARLLDGTGAENADDLTAGDVLAEVRSMRAARGGAR